MGAAIRFTQNPGRNAICYYRCSSDAQRDVSIEQQQEAAAKYAKDLGLRIIKEYAGRAAWQRICKRALKTEKCGI